MDRGCGDSAPGGSALVLIMKILLTAVNAKYIHSNLAVYSLRACAKKRGLSVDVREFTVNQPAGHVLEEIYLEQPEILCFSCYIWNITYIEGLIRDLARLLPQTPIWLGGPEVSFETENFLLSHPEVTGVMVGEGEETFCELMAFYEHPEGKNLEDIRGLVFRRQEFAAETAAGDGMAEKEMTGKEMTGKGTDIRAGRELVRTGEREPMAMDDIPFPYEDLEHFSNRIIYYESSRGCPFSCSYCLSSVDKCLRFRSTDLVKRELQFFIDHRVPQVKFVDRTFNCNHRHAMEIWRFIRERDRGVTNFHFEISADLLTEEELAFLGTLRPGLVQLEIGVQSVNERTIAQIHRHMDLTRVKAACAQIRRGRNIHQHLDLIAGLPEEDFESFHRSFNEIYELRPDQLQLGFLKVLKGSYIYENRKSYDLLSGSLPPYEVLSTRWLSYREVIRLKQVEEMVEVYYNSGQFPASMELLERASEDAFLLYDAMGDFYRERGYFDMSHSRARRCEILLEFASSRQFAGVCRRRPEEEILRQTLTFDIYSRENAKARPSFALGPPPSRELRRKWEERGKSRHLEWFTREFWRFLETFGGLEEAVWQDRPGAWALFDYDSRDPLNRRARVTPLKGEPGSAPDGCGSGTD